MRLLISIVMHMKDFVSCFPLFYEKQKQIYFSDCPTKLFSFNGLETKIKLFTGALVLNYATPERLLADMNNNGIRKAVIHQINPPDTNSADIMEGIITRNERLYTFGAVHPFDQDIDGKMGISDKTSVCTQGGEVYHFMKVIAIAAVTAGGKTTTVNELKKQLSNVQTLHFDDYVFEGEVDDFYQWVLDGADYNVWNLEPLEKDILRIENSGTCDYLILDYPFAYCNEQIRKYIDMAFFIDIPLDIALARRILRDMGNASGEEIRNDLRKYLQYARIAFVQMQKDIVPSSDYVIDGTMSTESIAENIIRIII